ncbi:MAG TPA: hypothetical protein VGK99_03985 [Acidobacteriota bacterium]|jgi:hypothetical protein
MSPEPKCWEEFHASAMRMVSDTLILTARRFEDARRLDREAYEAERQKDKEAFIEILDAAAREIRASIMTAAAIDYVEQLRNQLKAGDVTGLLAPEGVINNLEVQQERA